MPPIPIADSNSRLNDLERLPPLQQRPVLSIIDLYPDQTHWLATLDLYDFTPRHPHTLAARDWLLMLVQGTTPTLAFMDSITYMGYEESIKYLI
jgi:hypothetical protein